MTQNPLRQQVKALLSKAFPASLFMTAGPPGSREIALTFDDGPHPLHTPRLLDELGRLEVRASFFFRGDRVLRYPDIARRAVAEGHDAGNHSFSHGEPSETSFVSLAEELSRTSALIAAITGVRPTLFRPPKGQLTPAKLAATLALRHTTVLWNHDSKDFSGTTDSVRDYLESSPLSGGDIALFHDTFPIAHSVLPAIVARARQSGLGFTTISAWLGAAPNHGTRATP